MLKTKHLIIITIPISIILAVLCFYQIKFWPNAAFEIYNILAVLVGIVLVYIPCQLLKTKTGNKKVHYLTILIGAGMSVVHIVKLVVGYCT